MYLNDYPLREVHVATICHKYSGEAIRTVGVYSSLEEAQQARRKVKAAGYSNDFYVEINTFILNKDYI